MVVRLVVKVPMTRLALFSKQHGTKLKQVKSEKKGENPFGLHFHKKDKDQGEMEAEGNSKLQISKPGNET